MTPSDEQPLLFYGSLSLLSNMHPVTIIIDGLKYRSVEHYFQSQKFIKEESRNRIRAARSPFDAARLGRQLPDLRVGWDIEKVSVMERALIAKFTQNYRCKRYLLSTGTRELIEDSRTDYFWGCGRNHTGLNMLGHLLMRTREDLRKSG
jgi:N-glycosidase YbiA